MVDIMDEDIEKRGFTVRVRITKRGNPTPLSKVLRHCEQEMEASASNAFYR